MSEIDHLSGPAAKHRKGGHIAIVPVLPHDPATGTGPPGKVPHAHDHTAAHPLNTGASLYDSPEQLHEARMLALLDGLSELVAPTLMARRRLHPPRPPSA